MSRAEQIFDEFASGGYGRVAQIVATNEPESLFLDFKEFFPKALSGNSDPSFKETLAKAASAFANTEGGVLVWGVKAKNKQSRELKPISNGLDALQMIQSAANDILDPVLPGIRSFFIEDQASPAKGYIATLIPQSFNKPHQMRSKGGYYIRTEDNSSLLSHEFVKALILARTKPELVVELRRRSANVRTRDFRPGDKLVFEIEFDLWIRNDSEAIAQNAAIGIQSDMALHMNSDVARTAMQLRRTYENDFVPGSLMPVMHNRLYPGTEYRAAFVTLRLSRDELDVDVKPDILRVKKEFLVKLFAADYTATGTISFMPNEEVRDGIVAMQG